tara:strand:- start:219 stop:596 length:378 start_codon:yes stop_codon:yes gene_type:complete
MQEIEYYDPESDYSIFYMNGNWYIDESSDQWTNTCKSYRLNGFYHRLDGPAIEFADGYKLWYFNDKLHREDGPAVEHINGEKSWWVNGYLHRLDGPAIEHADGEKQWYLKGVRLTEEEFLERCKK